MNSYKYVFQEFRSFEQRRMSVRITASWTFIKGLEPYTRMRTTFDRKGWAKTSKTPSAMVTVSRTPAASTITSWTPKQKGDDAK